MLGVWGFWEKHEGFCFLKYTRPDFVLLNSRSIFSKGRILLRTFDAVKSISLKCPISYIPYICLPPGWVLKWPTLNLYNFVSTLIHDQSLYDSCRKLQAAYLCTSCLFHPALNKDTKTV